MAEITVTLSDLKKGIKFKAGEASQVKVIRAQRTRLIGMFFDLNKCFLLPSATLAIKSLVKTYEEHPQSELLAVGHTDTSGQEAYNETLSLERAQAVASYLADKVADWEAFFGEGKPAEKRWGLLEVQHMLTRLPQGKPAHYAGTPNGANDAKHQTAVKAYQADKGLKVDGIAGPDTRKALITDYMALDGTSLPQDASLTVHGCGENFPVQETGDSVRSAENRRVEIFFFDGPITPPPEGKISRKGAKDYPEWLKAVETTIDLSGGASPSGKPAVLIGLHPPLFNAIPEAATITFAPDQGPATIFKLKQGLNLGDGLLHYRVEDPQPGAKYKASVRMKADGKEIVLFTDHDLHALATSGSQGGSAPELGHDGLVFDTPPETVAPDFQTGGPGNTSFDAVDTYTQLPIPSGAA
jgi:outer membrane protein OmpA-like peptidoglycan-associated protein